MTTEFSIIRDDEAIAVSVEWKYRPRCPGQRDAGGGLPIEPDDPEEMEFLRAFDARGEEIELTPAEVKEAESDAWERLGRPNRDE